MRRFWDRRAREDAFYFVDNRLQYRDPDLGRFWEEGEVALDKTLAAAGKSVREGDVIIDIGCGVGRLTRPLAARARRVWGVEVSEQMLELAQRHNPDLGNVEWLLGHGSSLAGIPEGSVDGIVSLVVFQHIPDPAVVMAYVREMGRVLRPGGWAAFHVSNDPGIHQPPGLAARLLGAVSRRRPGGQSDPAWLGSAVNLDELRRVAAQSHLAIDRITGEGTQFCIVGAHRVECNVSEKRGAVAHRSPDQPRLANEIREHALAQADRRAPRLPALHGKAGEIERVGERKGIGPPAAPAKHERRQGAAEDHRPTAQENSGR
jgi:SAM-dependent methyltransferase